MVLALGQYYFMSRRRDVFCKGGYYHIYNKTLNKNKIFLEPDVAERFLDSVAYYKYDIGKRIRFSKFLEKTDWDRSELIDSSSKVCEVIAYCLMPNHYHLLVRQKENQSISNIMARIVDSITRYYNIKYNHSGPVFLPRFKSKTILSEEQLIHVARYIHLNPYSGNVVKTVAALSLYQYSSYGHYLNKLRDAITDTDLLREYFSIGSNQKKFVKFTEDQAEWQKTLEYVKNPDKWS